MQKTFLRAYRFWHRFEQGTNIKAWLFSIQTNIFINDYRKRQTEQNVIDDREVDDLLGRYEVQQSKVLPPHTDQDFLSHLLGDEVMQALDRLPFEFRMAVLLADMHDFSYKEIAEVLDCPVGTVMSRLHRARRLMQAQLFEYALQRGILKAPEAAQEDGKVYDLEAFRQRRKRAAGG